MWVCGIFSFLMFFVTVIVIFYGLFFCHCDLSVLCEWVMFRFGGMDFSFILLFDFMSLVFCSVVLFISGCVFIFSIGYMGSDSSLFRFCLLVFMFIFFMVMVIFSPSFISILLGWDGLGLVSYCLVIYYQNYKSYNGGMLTGISNRFGDVGILLGIGVLFDYGSWVIVNMDSVYFIGLLSVCVFFAGFSKSAQIPFSAWLPAAMAAPTPVSALVHSSTLVTAGVYFIIRFSGVWSVVGWWSLVVFYFGVATMLMAGFLAVFEVDMSKIIALSTLSQLGMMVMAVGLGGCWLAFFHLVTHALFSALLFLCGGKIIHLFLGEQDLRYMGCVVGGSLISFVSLNVANFCLCGLPFLSGFYSSDLIIERFGYSDIGYFSLFLVFWGVVFTLIYSVSFGWLVGADYFKYGLNNWNDYEVEYSFSMSLLVCGGIFGGVVFFWLGLVLFEEDMIFGMISYLPLVFIFCGVFGGLIFLWFFFVGINFTCGFFYLGWYLPNLSSSLISHPLVLSYYFSSLFDYGWGEMLSLGVFRLCFVNSSGLLGYFGGFSLIVMLLSVVLWFFFLWMISL